MQYALVSLQLLGFAAIAVGIVGPTLRRKMAAWVAGLGLFSAIAGIVCQGDQCSLEISHRFSAYVELQVKSKVFPIETVTAPCWQAFHLCALFGFGWAAWLFARRDAAHAFGAPLALAATGLALQFGLEKCAAPAALLAPFDLAPDRVLFPATVAGAILLAKPGRKILHLVWYLTLFVAVTRLPLAVFGTLATRGGWGTHLDVHGTVFFVPPGGGTSIGPIEVEPGGTEQLFWLIWAPHLIVYPLFYMMSTGGLAFLRLMYLRQKEVDAATSSPKA